MTWQHARGWTPPTLREVVAGMQANIAQAQREESAAEAAMMRFQPGDERLNEAKSAHLRARCEQPHWREQLRYWRGLLERFPELAERPAEEAVKAASGKPVDSKPAEAGAPPPHWTEARERQPGDDDFDRIPF